MVGMRFFRSGPQANLAGLREVLGSDERVLAQGVGADVVLAGTRINLAMRTEGTWRAWPWEEIAAGAWDAQARRFTWRTFDGEEIEASLDDAGALPQLFRERIQAATVVSALFDTASGQVHIVGRRGLGAKTRLRFYAMPSGGADLAEPRTRDQVVAETQRLREEFL